MKKIIAISDTHNKHGFMPKSWLDADDKENTILIHAGDISSIGGLDEIENFCLWFDKLDFPHKIFIAGNHDWGFQRRPDDVKKIIAKYPTIIYLEDSFVIIDGIKIWGSPWQPWFCNWAFNLERGKELKDKWDLIHDDIDILITHGPVYGILDKTPSGKSVGCGDLLNTINSLKNLKLHICGHIHCGYGTKVVNEITYINASILDEDYMVTNEPIRHLFVK